VPPLSLASIAAGTDALLVEVHPNPDRPEGRSTIITLGQFQIDAQLQAVAKAIGRSPSLTAETTSVRMASWAWQAVADRLVKENARRSLVGCPRDIHYIIRD